MLISSVPRNYMEAITPTQEVECSALIAQHTYDSPMKAI